MRSADGYFDSALSRAWTNAVGSDYSASPTLNAMVDGGRIALTLQQSTNYGIAARERLGARAQEMATARGGGVRF